MRIPLATYRLQFNRAFGLEQARELLPYLRKLGISDLYASPLFVATPESSHGYDVCGFDRLNPNLGTTGDLERLAADLRDGEMGLLLDIVPNHMGSHHNNCWWYDVLKHGQKSRFARFFDIDWNSVTPGLAGKVLLPVLGDHYAAVLERGELRVAFGYEGPRLEYFDKRFPLSPESEEAFGLHEGSESVEKLLASFYSGAGNVSAFDKLHSLIEMQHYRLAFWRTGPHEINYRRFFDVTDLVSMRVEDSETFDACHKYVFELLESGAVTGLRVDHPDGLRDPKTYFERLQERIGKPVYVVAEKILSDEERLPEEWPVQGTTGYDFLNVLNGVFVQRANEPVFTGIYERFTGSCGEYAAVAFQSERHVLEQMFVSEVNALTRRLKQIASKTRYGVDFSAEQLRRAIIDFIAAFPVYRTYVADANRGVSSAERKFIRGAQAEAERRTGGNDASHLEFLARILSLENLPDFNATLEAEAREFVIRFQQLSGPGNAKGLEDTAFYRYNRFVSLNEVGGNPGRFGVRTNEFHEYNRYKAGKWPHSLLATSTHDTKRGEDVRARLNVLSEIPEDWEKAIGRWRDLNSPFNSTNGPTPNDEYLLYQTLVGTWSPGLEPAVYMARIQQHMLKATREAKLATSWTSPNEAYEEGIRNFVRDILGSKPFMKDLDAFSEEVSFYGMFNSLSQVVMKVCSPGVPDFYQGTELWDLSLVDPDNRRPVDFAMRKDLLRAIRNRNPAELLADWTSGGVKLFTMAAALKARHEFREIFRGEYHAVPATGSKQEHLLACVRTSTVGMILAAVPRFMRTLTGGNRSQPSTAVWGDTALEFRESSHFRNLITREEHASLRAAELFKSFPVAILLALH